MAQVIVRLQGTDAITLGRELHDCEIGLVLKDIGSDKDDRNYGIYDKKFVVPVGDIVLLPEASVPPEGAKLIEKGPLFVGGVKQDFVAYRLATES